MNTDAIAPTGTETVENTIGQTAEQATAAESQVSEEGQAKEERSFSQAEVDALIQKRLAKEARRSERRIAEELAKVRQTQQTPPSSRDEFAPDDIDRLATERAQQMRREEAIARQSEDIRSAAIEAAGGEGKFAQALATVVEEAGPLADLRTGQWTPLGEAIAESDKPGELLVYLGRNPDVAETLQGLTGGRLHRAVAKIEAQMQTKAVPPPKPLKPVTPSGVTAGRSAAQMTDAEWYAARRGRK